jgi:chromosome segregation protein
MEVADALYGVTMRGDGVTTVISQKLRDKKTGAMGDAPKVPAQQPGAAAEPSAAAVPAAGEPAPPAMEDEPV